LSLELSTALAGGWGRKVFVVVAESTERDGERLQWIEASKVGLEAAYGESEPEYTRAMVREANAAYGT
jgi:hypothetical protein